MNIKKTTLATLISGVLLLALPISSTFASEQRCEIKETELGQLMKHMKSELRGYVKGFKSEDQEKMQAHLNELLTLAEKAHQFIPVTISNLKEMDHSNMNMTEMEGMDHSNMNMTEMENMDHSNMNMTEMESMDHSNMNMTEMEGMDHSNMNMTEMENLDHSNMNMTEMEGMDHSKMSMAEMENMDHDMSAMSNMKGMNTQQHHQHLKYMQGMNELQRLFKALNETKERDEIKVILGKVKEHSKKSHQIFRQDCS